MFLTERDAHLTRVYLTLPQIALDDLIFVWVMGFYNGALTGLVRYGGCLHYFTLCDEDYQPGGFYRRYTVHPLSAEQIAFAEQMHRDFMRFVGLHGSFDEEGNPLVHDFTGYAPENTSDVFYSRYPQEDTSWEDAVIETTPVGWFPLFR
jgi:hypothetical protein